MGWFPIWVRDPEKLIPDPGSGSRGQISTGSGSTTLGPRMCSGNIDVILVPYMIPHGTVEVAAQRSEITVI
jgi:hypothetical protein